MRSPKPSLSMMALNSLEVPVYSKFYLLCNLVPDQEDKGKSVSFLLLTQNKSYHHSIALLSDPNLKRSFGKSTT